MDVLGEKQVGRAMPVRGDADPVASNPFETFAFPLEHSSSTVHHKIGLLPLFCSLHVMPHKPAKAFWMHLACFQHFFARPRFDVSLVF